MFGAAFGKKIMGLTNGLFECLFVCNEDVKENNWITLVLTPVSFILNKIWRQLKFQNFSSVAYHWVKNAIKIWKAATGKLKENVYGFVQFQNQKIVNAAAYKMWQQK